ncbi:MAG: hypothetical protein QNJ36_09695 [Calothrix sp. MO_167.B42]|nr:hypothetical protein [Calothrix sp. MO_167.B42]
MKKLIRNSLIASVVAVAGVVSGAGASFAGSTTLDLNGTVPPSCNFDQASYSNSAPDVYGKGDGTTNELWWEGSFDVSCNHGGQVNITVDDVTESDTVATARELPEYYAEYFSVTDGSNYQTLWANGEMPNNTSSHTYNTGSLYYNFSLYVDTNTPSSTGLPAGDYSYTISMTAAPN